MAVIEASMTLAELVSTHPELTRQLERRELDYCCGGQRSLAEACARQGLDPTEVASELEAAVDTSAAPEDWATMPAEQLVDHLESRHHRYLWEELPRLSALIDKVVRVHGGRHPELLDIQSCFDAIQTDLQPHMLKEERVLFPMIRELAASDTMPAFHCGSLRNPISVMMREHDAVGELLAHMRVLTDDYVPPADGCASYAALFGALAELELDTHLHVHKENHLLFPAVLAAESGTH